MNPLQKATIFFREVYVELKKVSWFSRSQVVRYTIMVLVVTIVVSGLLGALDYVFSSILKSLIVK